MLFQYFRRGLYFMAWDPCSTTETNMPQMTVTPIQILESKLLSVFLFSVTCRQSLFRFVLDSTEMSDLYKKKQHRSLNTTSNQNSGLRTRSFCPDESPLTVCFNSGKCAVKLVPNTHTGDTIMFLSAAISSTHSYWNWKTRPMNEERFQFPKSNIIQSDLENERFSIYDIRRRSFLFFPSRII